MIGRDLYDLFRNIHEDQYDCGIDSWEDIGSMEQGCWNELARKLTSSGE